MNHHQIAVEILVEYETRLEQSEKPHTSAVRMLAMTEAVKALGVNISVKE